MSDRAGAKARQGSGRALRAAAWSDERLVRECLKGNEEAWCALIDKYKNLIYSVPIKFRASPEGAGEIFQQVCLELVTALPQLRDSKSLGAWLITVTSHKCLAWTRREQRYQPLDPDEPDTGARSLSRAPDTLLLEVEREQILREALPQIGPRCQELIRMLFYESPAVPYEEVARSLGLAKGSIGFTRMRCLKRLRRLLQQKGFL